MTSFEDWLGDVKIAVIGLGYVGLPLAVEFGKKYPVVGFDIKQARIDALMEGRDETLETTSDEMRGAQHLTFTCNPSDLADSNVYIVTVPTPIDNAKRPDLTPLIKASEALGKVLKRGDIVIYESTVYPGATEEDCVPVLEQVSGLTFNQDFFAGYSPERINPGDKTHRLPDIRKVTSGSTQEVAETVDKLYASIITAGTYKAGYHPEIILSGRRLNDSMGAYVAGQLVKAMIKKRIQVDGARILVLGLTFKEDCPDLRTTRVIDLIRELESFGMDVDIHDPWAHPQHAQSEYGLEVLPEPEVESYDGIVLAVAHGCFRELELGILRSYGRKNHVFYDLKGAIPATQSDLRL